MFALYWRLLDSWDRFQALYLEILGTGCVDGNGGNLCYGSVDKEGRDEIDATGNSTEFGVEDCLGYPYEKGDVDEDVDSRCVG